ncbi:hypothetical protein CEXT_431701, partial [Caerostris extrusa]
RLVEEAKNIPHSSSRRYTNKNGVCPYRQTGS